MELQHKQLVAIAQKGRMVVKPTHVHSIIAMTKGQKQLDAQNSCANRVAEHFQQKLSLGYEDERNHRFNFVLKQEENCTAFTLEAIEEAIKASRSWNVTNRPGLSLAVVIYYCIDD